MNILRRIEGLRDWLGLHRREKAARGGQKRKRIKPLYGKVWFSDKKGVGVIWNSGYVWRENAPFPEKWAIGEGIGIDSSFFFVRE